MEFNDTACNCFRGKCVPEGNKFVCQCPPDYGYFTPFECRECNCGQGSNCTFEFYGFLNTKHKTHCVCKEGYKAENNKCVGPCSGNPCKNGQCTEIKNDYQCICTDGFIGKNCEYFDFCAMSPCKNGGSCQNDKNSYKCFCPSGYLGDDCSRIDFCAKTTCRNGGTCENDINNYKCLCKSGYLGDNCATIETCENTNLPNCKELKRECKSTENGIMRCGECFKSHIGNDGEECFLETCKNTKLSKCKDLKRKCKSIWNGVMECGECLENHLENEGKVCFLDPCSRDPCKNDGICKVENESFICFCRQPYYGYTCEEDSCSNNPCMNNGICETKNENFVCFCRYPFYGDTCEKNYNTSTFDPTVLFSTTSPYLTTVDLPSNETVDFNQTSETPLDFTVDYNKTTDFKDNLNITTALPTQTTSVDGLFTSIIATTLKPVMYIFRNVYTIQNLTEMFVKA